MMSKPRDFLRNLRIQYRNYKKSRHGKPDLKLQPRDRKEVPKYYLTAVIIVKDDELYLDEWINFHLMMGCEHIYIYDNESVDRTYQLLRRYVRKGVVTFKRWRKSQKLAYFDAIRKYGKDSRWMMFIDIDEFVFPSRENNLKDALYPLERFPCVVLPWHMFGDSGHLERPDGLVIENYTHRTVIPNPDLAPPEQKAITKPKCIVDPFNVNTVSVHNFEPRFGRGQVISDGRPWISNAWRPSGNEEMVLNHYYTRSKKEFTEKLEKHRTSKMHPPPPGFEAKMTAIADAINRQSIEDIRIKRFVKPLKDYME